MSNLIHRIIRSLIVQLAFLTSLTVGATICFLNNNLLWGIIFGIIIILLFVYIRLQSQENTKKILFMLDAIENSDNSFKFSNRNLTGKNKQINESLNRVTQILYNAKIETVQKEKYYELILNTVNTGILVLNDNGSIYQSNNEAMRLLGLHVLTHIKQLAQIDPTLPERFSDFVSGTKEQISFANEQGTVNLSVKVSDIVIRNEHLRILAMNDIKNELEEKEIDSWIKLTRVLTHEIMNSVTPITSLSDTLLTLPETNEEMKNGLKVISTTGKGLISFIESYRKFTHIPKPSPSLFYVTDFIGRMVELARHQKPHPNIKIETTVMPADLLVYADENLIAQVVTNLLKNAVQAIGNKPNGIIIITAKSNAADEVVIEIHNNGPAIPPEVTEHIFIPFFTTKEEGSGIGLSISRQIMRMSGGSLTLKHSSKEEGTTFRLTFS